MTTEIITGLHACKAENAPVIGQVKTFVVEQKTSKGGKAYLRIKSAGPDYGGTPFRILEAEPTGFTDNYGNISFNLGIEPAVSGESPSAISQPRTDIGSSAPTAQAVQSQSTATDGVQETREHLMRSANLLVLCIRAVEKAVAPHQPVVAQTSEQFQSDVAKLFIEASKRITNDGVTWWSYVDKMPVKPLESERPF